MPVALWFAKEFLQRRFPESRRVEEPFVVTAVVE
jgi:hypothetical protein